MKLAPKALLSELFSCHLHPKQTTIQVMPESLLNNNSLVLYKQRAARIIDTGSKRIMIELMDGEQLRVRPKDVILLHPGPISDLSGLSVHPDDRGDLLAAWELLAGNKTNLQELVELAYGVFTPAAAWSVWKMVADGMYFSGNPDLISVFSAEQVHQEKARREAREQEQRKWDEFVGRIAGGKKSDGDSLYLRDVEALALGEQSQSQVLRALGREQTPENAHDLLLQVGYWETSVNPYPSRAGVKTTSAQGVVSPLADEPRRDLTHLLALAIDDEGNEDPDDALSWDNGRIWVHIADVASLVTPDSPLDLEARKRGANLYLPEETVSMLPAEVTRRLGLGLEDRSPALSFGIDLTPDGLIYNIELVPSWVNVTRWTYEGAEERLAEPVPAKLLEIARIYERRRREAGAIEINLPEVRLKVRNGDIVINPILPLQSRDIVREAMLMTGEAVAIFAQTHEIAIPYTTQVPPSAQLPEGNSTAEMFAARKLLKPSRQSITPGSHSGLGMAQYAQVTSPLRRYLDLVIHQQLRAFLQNQTLLTQQEIIERIGATASIQRDLRRTERLSRRHWTLVYLLKHSEWQGEGVIVEKHGRRYKAILPDLDLDSDLYLAGENALNSRVLLNIQDVNLAYLNTRFTKIASPQSS